MPWRAAAGGCCHPNVGCSTMWQHCNGAEYAPYPSFTAFALLVYLKGISSTQHGHRPHTMQLFQLFLKSFVLTFFRHSTRMQAKVLPLSIYDVVLDAALSAPLLFAEIMCVLAPVQESMVPFAFQMVGSFLCFWRDPSYQVIPLDSLNQGPSRVLPFTACSTDSPRECNPGTSLKFCQGLEAQSFLWRTACHLHRTTCQYMSLLKGDSCLPGII